MLNDVLDGLQFLLNLIAGRQYAVSYARGAGMAGLLALTLTVGYYAAASYSLARRAKKNPGVQAKLNKAMEWRLFGYPIFSRLLQLRPRLQLPALVCLTLAPLGFLIVLAALMAWSYSIQRLVVVSAALNSFSYAAWDKGLGTLMERFGFINTGLRVVFVILVGCFIIKWVFRRYCRWAHPWCNARAGDFWVWAFRRYRLTRAF